MEGQHFVWLCLREGFTVSRMLINLNAVFSPAHAAESMQAILFHNIVKEPIRSASRLLGCEIFLPKFRV